MELKDLLAKISDHEYEIDRLIESNPASVLSDFESFYQSNPRHYYHEVFLFLKEFDKQDDLDFFVEKIRLAKEYFDSNAGEMLISQVNKLYDHIKLEVERNRVLEDLKTKITQSIRCDIDAHKKELTDIRTDIDFERVQITSIGEKLRDVEGTEQEARRLVDDLKNKVNDVYMQFVTILGIFTAIVFAIFGGISSINSTVAILANNSIPFSKAMLIVCVIVAIMVNLMYLFVFLMGKLINRPVGHLCNGAIECHGSGCKKPNKDGGILCRLRNRHGMMVLCNAMIIVISITLIGVHFRGTLSTIIKNAISKPESSVGENMRPESMPTTSAEVTSNGKQPAPIE